MVSNEKPWNDWYLRGQPNACRFCAYATHVFGCMVFPQAVARPMPAPVNRISVSTASTRQQKLLEYEAKLTGRSVSSLASALLEEIVDQKVHAGQWHVTTDMVRVVRISGLFAISMFNAAIECQPAMRYGIYVQNMLAE